MTFSNKITDETLVDNTLSCIIMPDYGQVQNYNNILLTHILHKKNNLLARKQKRRIALLKALNNDNHTININNCQFSEFIKRKLIADPEYFDFQNISYQSLETEKNYDIQDQNTPEPIILH